MKIQSKKGFTLIELMIVIAIIGILAVTLIPSLTGAQAKARDTGRLKNVRDGHTALNGYFQDKAIFPTSTELSGKANCFSDADGKILNKSVAGYFKNEIAPLDNTAGNKTTPCAQANAMAYKAIKNNDDIDSQAFIIYQDVETTASANFNAEKLGNENDDNNLSYYTNLLNSNTADVDTLSGDDENSVFLMTY